MFSPHQITKGAALALAFGAVAAPAASAMRIGDNGAQALVHKAPVVKAVPLGPHPITPPFAYWRQHNQFVPSRPSPGPADTRTVAPNTGMGQTGATAAYVAAHRLQTSAQVGAAAPSLSNSFDWGDAGIGAAGGLAIAMLGVGGGLALSQRRSRRTATTTLATG
jgi:hypothetical protein